MGCKTMIPNAFKGLSEVKMRLLQSQTNQMDVNQSYSLFSMKFPLCVTFPPPQLSMETLLRETQRQYFDSHLCCSWDSGSTVGESHLHFCTWHIFLHYEYLHILNSKYCIFHCCFNHCIAFYTIEYILCWTYFYFKYLFYIL